MEERKTKNKNKINIITSPNSVNLSNTTPEKLIIDFPDPVSLSGTKTILRQMKKCICTMKIENKVGTGFFCKIPVEKNKTMKCLMTCNHVLEEKNYDEINEINLFLNDEEEVKVIDLTVERKTYFNKVNDITLIQLIDDDNINNFLELDNKLKEAYKDSSIYVIQYPNGKKATVSYGLLRKINDYDMKHQCSTESGSSGSPILNLETNKVIGIHKSADSNTMHNFNYGTFLRDLLNQIVFKAKKNSFNINELNINKSDSWLHIFEQTINNYDKEKLKKKMEKKNKKIEDEINEIVKNKIQEIKRLHNKFEIFNGITEKSNPKFVPSLKNMLVIMTCSIIGLSAFDEKNGNINFTDIETQIKSRIRKNLVIRDKSNAEKYLTERNEKFFLIVIKLLYNYNYFNRNNEEILSLLNGWCAWKTIAKTVVDNNFCYNTEEELDKYFDTIITEIINDIKNKNNYKRKFDFSSGSLIDGDVVYQKVIDNFNYLQNINGIQKNFVNFKNLIKHDLNMYVKSFSVINPIKYGVISKNGKIPWI